MFPSRPNYVKFGKSASSNNKPEGLYDAVVTKVVYEGSLTVAIDAVVDTPSTSLIVEVDGLIGSINETGLRPRIYARIPRLINGFEFGPLAFIGPIPSVGDRVFVGFKEGNPDNIVLLSKGAQTVTGGNGASTPIALDDLTDVIITIPQDRDFVIYNGSEWANASLGFDGLADVTITNPQDGDFVIYNGGEWANASLGDLSGYTVGETLYYTTSDTFTKADYPNMAALVVHCQGGGGAGGGGAATGSGQRSAGGGGAGGTYARRFVLVEDLSTSETITVGAGGTGVSGSAGNNGTASSLGTHCTGNGGDGGSTLSAGGTFGTALGGLNGGGTGDLVVFGDEGGVATRLSDASVISSWGGGTFLAPITRNISFAHQNGNNGEGYGGGGSGAMTGTSNSATTGGNGANGIVIIEVLYTAPSAVGGGTGTGGGDAGVEDILMLMGA